MGGCPPFGPHTDGAGAVVASYAYTYDAENRLASVTDIDGTVDYVYDGRGQLTGADYTDTAQADEDYTYDVNGSRLSSTNASGTQSSYATGDHNQLLNDGVYAYTYDDEGNLATRTETATSVVRTFVWDFQNRLVGVNDAQADGAVLQAVAFTYDAAGRRTSQTTDGSTQQFVYQGTDVRLELTDGVLSARNLHGPQTDEILVRELFAATLGGSSVLDATSEQALWHLSDHLGTVRDLIDADGLGVSHRTFDAFGNLTSESDASFDTRYAFTGREFDEATGLAYHRGRYYDPFAGRFISEDPSGFGGGDDNLYRYVGNAVTTFVDPDGLARQDAGVYQPSAGAQAYFADREIEIARQRADRDRAIAEQDAFLNSRLGRLQGGASVTANTLTFGATDHFGITESDCFHGAAYNASRVVAGIARDVGLGLATGGAGAALRGGQLSGVALNGARGVFYGGTAYEVYQAGESAYAASGNLARGEFGAAALNGFGALAGVGTLRAVDDIARGGGAAGRAGAPGGGEIAPNRAVFNGGTQGDPIDPIELARIREDFARTGGVIDQSPEAQEFLRSRGAGGVTFDAETILLPENPTRTAVFEELIHARQFSEGLVSSSSINRLEILAAEELITNRRALNIPNPETRQTIQNLRNLRAAESQ